jgi:hypothetical protein
MHAPLSRFCAAPRVKQSTKMSCASSCASCSTTSTHCEQNKRQQCNLCTCVSMKSTHTHTRGPCDTPRIHDSALSTSAEKLSRSRVVRPANANFAAAVCANRVFAMSASTKTSRCGSHTEDRSSCTGNITTPARAPAHAPTAARPRALQIVRLARAPSRSQTPLAPRSCAPCRCTRTHASVCSTSRQMETHTFTNTHTNAHTTNKNKHAHTNKNAYLHWQASARTHKHTHTHLENLKPDLPADE